MSYGGTSGRFHVAKVIARMFPEHNAFVQSVVAEGMDSASSFPVGPYPNDKLTYRSKSTVEYETPTNAEGLGTISGLQQDANPINGVAILIGADTDLIQLAARLSTKDRDLIPFMIRQVEHEAKFDDR